MGCLVYFGFGIFLALYVWRRELTPRQQDERRAIGSALHEISRVTAISPVLGGPIDFGPPPPDRIDDDTYTTRVGAAPPPPPFEDPPAR